MVQGAEEGPGSLKGQGPGWAIAGSICTTIPDLLSKNSRDPAPRTGIRSLGRMPSVTSAGMIGTLKLSKDGGFELWWGKKACKVFIFLPS